MKLLQVAIAVIAVASLSACESIIPKTPETRAMEARQAADHASATHALFSKPIGE